MKHKDKVFAYITKGKLLLLFTHPYHPEAGIQVPAGTVKNGESYQTAVMREAMEETGLTGLVLGEYLGKRQQYIPEKDEMHHRYFFHLLCTQATSETWRHGEMDPDDTSENHKQVIDFDFFWAKLPNEIPQLIANHDALLHKLVDVLD